MIRPGLLIASTSKADHFGTSANCFWFSIVVAPFWCCGFGFLALKRGFPPRRDVGYDWALDRTPGGAKRSGALGGFAESCACGLSWHNRPAKGELNQMSRCEF